MRLHLHCSDALPHCNIQDINAHSVIQSYFFCLSRAQCVRSSPLQRKGMTGSLPGTALHIITIAVRWKNVAGFNLQPLYQWEKSLGYSHSGRDSVGLTEILGVVIQSGAEPVVQYLARHIAMLSRFILPEILILLLPTCYVNLISYTSLLLGLISDCLSAT